MSAIPWSMDSSSKRWLVALTTAAAASVAFVGYSFVKTLSPTESSVVAPQKPASARVEEPVTRSEPDWNGVTVGQAAEISRTAAVRPDPFAAQDAAAARAAAANDPVANQQAVHREAEYLRNLISQGKLPESYGKLTKEKVDQMEKDGIMIE